MPFFARPSGSPLSPFLSRDSLAASWTISSVLVNLGVSKLDKSKDITLRWYVKHVLPIGAFAAISLALGNYTYLYLSVSFIQMLKAAVPCVTMIVLVGTGLERPHRMTVLGVSILTFGTAARGVRRNRVSVDRRVHDVQQRVLRGVPHGGAAIPAR